MAMAKQLFSICILAALIAAAAAAQAIVGYGVLTGATATGASAAGQAAAKNLGRLGAVAGPTAPLPASPRVNGAENGAVQLANRRSEEPSIVLHARWGQAVEPAADGLETVVGPEVAPAPAAAAATPEPTSFQRGGDIADVIAELGKPALVINGSGSGGYDRKYVFRSGDGARYAVLVLGGRIVDWSDR